MRFSQIISLALVIIAISFEIWWMCTHKEDLLLSIPKLSWLLHIFVFYIAIWFNMPNIHFTLWSSALRLHGVITILSMTLYHMNGREDKWKKIL